MGGEEGRDGTECSLITNLKHENVSEPTAWDKTGQQKNHAGRHGPSQARCRALAVCRAPTHRSLAGRKLRFNSPVGSARWRSVLVSIRNVGARGFRVKDGDCRQPAHGNATRSRGGSEEERRTQFESVDERTE